MKHLAIRTAQVIVSLLITLSCHAQLSLPFNVRTQYVKQYYHLSTQQADNYEEVLNAVLIKWEALKNKKCTPSVRQSTEIELQKELCTRVKAIFPDKQYTLWNDNHRGNLVVRFYKEDLGMSGEQFTQFRALQQTLSTKKEQISNMNILEAERAKLRSEAQQQYVEGLRNIVSKEIADYLIYENKVMNMAKILSKKYTLISENKAIQYAILKMEYEEKRKALNTQSLPRKQHRKLQSELNDSYEKSLRSLLTTEEYVACEKSRDKLTDSKFMQEYKMSDTQLTQYKELKKKLAMQELVIRQSRNDKAAKREKKRIAKVEFEKEMEELLGAEQYRRWKQNEELKSKK